MQTLNKQLHTVNEGWPSTLKIALNSSAVTSNIDMLVWTKHYRSL